MEQGDGLHGFRHLPAVQQLGQGLVQADHAFFQQAHDAGPGGCDLGEGGQVEERVFRHGQFFRLPLGAAVGPVKQYIPVFSGQKHRAGDQPVTAGAGKDFINTAKVFFHFSDSSRMLLRCCCSADPYPERIRRQGKDAALPPAETVHASAGIAIS